MLGALVLVTYVIMSIMRAADLSTIVPADQLELATQQVRAYWSAPWHLTLLGAVERLFAVTAHLAMSLMVMQALVRRRFWWVWAAVGFHALLDGVVVYAAQTGAGALQIEGLAGLFALAALAIIFVLRRAKPAPAAAEAASPLPVAAPAMKPGGEPPEDLDRTKYEP
jgi:uncharacterized membrane protein YhfC